MSAVTRNVPTFLSCSMDSLMRTILLAALALPACKVEIAPAPDSWHDVREDQGRTSLGDRLTLDGADFPGVTRFGEHIGIDADRLVVVETADGPCERRLRRFGLFGLKDGDPASSVEECEFPDARFGTDLHVSEDILTTGSSTLYGYSWQTPGEWVLPDDADGFLRSWSDDEDRESLHALPSRNRVEIRHDYWHRTPSQVLEAPAHLSDAAGFGTALHVLDDVLIVEDAFGGLHHFQRKPAYWDGSRHHHARWEPATGPSFDRILAVSGNEVLTQRNGFDDLEFVRFDPEAKTWSPSGTLPAHAAMGYTQWVFDEVALFALVPFDGVRRGVVDRFDRRLAELDASLSLLRPHTDAAMALDGHLLAVSETSGPDGVVHVFDWHDERRDKLSHLPGPHEGYCFPADSTYTDPIALEDHPTDQEEVYRFVGDATSGHDYTYDAWGRRDDAVWTGDGAAFFTIDVPGGRALVLTLADAWGGTATAHLDLEVDGEAIPIQASYDPVVQPDGTQRFVWHNAEGDWNTTRQVRLQITDDTFEDECVSFDLRASFAYFSCRNDAEPENDGYEGYLRWGDEDAGTFEELPDLLEVAGEYLSVRHLDDQVDRFRVTVPPGATLEITRPVGDIRYELHPNDLWGDTLYSNTDGTLTYTNEYDDEAQDLVLVVNHGWLYTACRPYELHTALRLPAPPADDTTTD
jgi:hypothetical protein